MTDNTGPRAGAHAPMHTPVPHRLGRSFLALWISSVLSNLADGVFKVAVPLVAAALTRDPMLVALVSVAATAPWLVLPLFVGVLVDRADRRSVMLVATAVRLVSLGALVGLFLWGDLAALPGAVWVLIGFALVLGTAEVLYDTAAQTILPQVVDRSLLTRANSRLYAGELVANTFVGPPLGGFLVGVALAAALGAPVVLWGLAGAALLLVRGTFRAREEQGEATHAETPRSVLRDIGTGMTFLWRNPVLRALAAMTGASNLASSAMFAVFVLYAVGPGSALGLTESGYGVLLTLSGVGAVLGSLVAARLVQWWGRFACLVLGVVLFACGILVPGIVPNVWVIGAVFVVNGLMIAVWNVTVVSLRQEITSDHLLGRLNSAYRLLAWGTQPVGAFLGGLVATVIGYRWTFIAFGLLALLTLVLAPAVTNARIEKALRAE